LLLNGCLPFAFFFRLFQLAMRVPDDIRLNLGSPSNVAIVLALG
jgi:hypothetical protein